MTAIEGLAVVGAIVLGGGGLWLLRSGRGRDVECGGGLSLPTRFVLGVSALLAGYHVFFWFGPSGAVRYGVPLGLWWVLVGGVVAALVGSVVADLIDGSCHGRVTGGDEAAPEDESGRI